MIAGMVVAAGASRRLGEPKQLLALGGRPLLGWVLDAMRAFAPHQIVLVLGHEAERIAASVDLSAVQVTINERYSEGLSTSLQVGLAALSPSIDSALIATGDQPFVTAEQFMALQEAHAASGLPIIATDYGAHTGVPLLLDRTVWPLAETISGDQGARPLLRTHPELVGHVPVLQPWMAMDVDTWEGYAEACALVERHRLEGKEMGA